MAEPRQRTKKMWHMKGAMKPARVRELGTVKDSLEKRVVELEICGKIETIQTTALLRSIIIESWRPNTGVKNSQIITIGARTGGLRNTGTSGD